MTDAKICGLSTPETLDAAVAGGATHVGFVIHPASPRHVDLDQLAALSLRVPSHVRRVGVFASADGALVEAAVRAGRLDIVQLHGVAPATAGRFRALAQIWGVIAVRTQADVAAGAAWRGAVDGVLYDAKTDGVLPGGMGMRFDWTLLRGIDHPAPWGVAGGLDPTNVADAIAVTGTPLVDVSSGVERVPGVKDVDKIAAFLQSAGRS